MSQVSTGDGIEAEKTFCTEFLQLLETSEEFVGVVLFGKFSEISSWKVVLVQSQKYHISIEYM